MLKKLLLYILVFLYLPVLFAFYQNPYTQTGEASYYAKILEGRATASGALYYSDSLTAAHRTLPFGTIVKVINLKNKREIWVEVNDRGPFASNRIIDLSFAAAKALDMVEEGIAEVKLEVMKPVPNHTVSDSIEH